MVQVAILSRRLREGKTYDDFRKAWYHTVGFGTANRMLTVINTLDPRETIGSSAKTHHWCQVPVVR